MIEGLLGGGGIGVLVNVATRVFAGKKPEPPAANAGAQRKAARQAEVDAWKGKAKLIKYVASLVFVAALMALVPEFRQVETVTVLLATLGLSQTVYDAKALAKLFGK